MAGYGHRIRPASGFTRQRFISHAKPFKVLLDSTELGEAKPRVNSTGSLGWRYDGKLQVKIGGVYVWVQANVILTVCGSKDLPLDPPVTTTAGG